MAGDKTDSSIKNESIPDTISSEKKPSTNVAAFKAFTHSRRDTNTSQWREKSVPKGQKREEIVEHCNYCGRDGHDRDGCFKRIGYPDWWPGKGAKQEKSKPRTTCIDSEISPIQGLTGEQYQQFLNLFTGGDKRTKTTFCLPRQAKPMPPAGCVEGEKSPIAGLSDSQYQQFVKLFGNRDGARTEESGPKTNLAGNMDKEGKWTVDSGATDHIIYDDSLLRNKRKRRCEPPVTIANGEAVSVEGRGDCTLPSGAIIREVLHVPKFKCNLLSVSRLSKELQCAITFFPDFCTMQDLCSRTLIGVGDCEDGLYKMGMFENKRHAMMTTQSLWHKRLGSTQKDNY